MNKCSEDIHTYIINNQIIQVSIGHFDKKSSLILSWTGMTHFVKREHLIVYLQYLITIDVLLILSAGPF